MKHEDKRLTPTKHPTMNVSAADTHATLNVSAADTHATLNVSAADTRNAECVCRLPTHTQR